MPKDWLLKALLLTFAICSSSCSTAEKAEDKYVDEGPKVTACVMDPKNGGYQCATYDQDPYFVGFDQVSGEGLHCLSPMDLETTLKSCKKGAQVSTPFCTVVGHQAACQDQNGAPLSLSLPQMDNYFCINLKDRKRLLERCTPRGY